MFHRLTFRRVVKKGNVEEFSCVPYILALFNCLLYTWYGLPVVSSGWENLPVFTINGLGILLEIAFISIYIWFAPREKKASDSIWIIVQFSCGPPFSNNNTSGDYRFAEVCLAVGASCCDILWLYGMFLKLFDPYAPYAQSCCWQCWFSGFCIDVQLSDGGGSEYLSYITNFTVRDEHFKKILNGTSNCRSKW